MIIKDKNYSLISTGSTGDKIRSMGFKCIDISKITKFKEMFEGRVKTLNPLIYSSILYKRENKFHIKDFLSLKIPEIDLKNLSEDHGVEKLMDKAKVFFKKNNNNLKANSILENE